MTDFDSPASVRRRPSSYIHLYAWMLPTCRRLLLGGAKQALDLQADGTGRVAASAARRARHVGRGQQVDQLHEQRVHQVLPASAVGIMCIQALGTACWLED